MSFDSFPTSNKIESTEKREFTVEEIRQLLKTIDSRERPDLAIEERIENIKGELISVVFSSTEKEVKNGVECKTNYLLTLPGQRYKSDGTPGKTISKTFLTRNYPDGEFWDEEVADHVGGEWTNFSENNVG